jgi:hypothetical protein
MNSAATLSGRALCTVPDAMEMLNLSRTVICEQIRSGRLLTVTQGPRRLVPALRRGYPTGKRQRRWVSRKTKTEAKQKLLVLRRDQTDGLPADHRTYTVREAVEPWREHGLTGRDDPP